MNKKTSEVEECYENVAELLAKELKKTPENDPDYVLGEFAYLLMMYKAGHSEYKSKMELFIKSQNNETIKAQMQAGYDSI
ncbi:hypothetical protein [Acinetobacter sp. WZC-1]|uniref:hypothetical protein n=1 Tax=Acinetobacter sp. WZC-1 TaxID=3459034 RepID=UPI00403E2D34